MSWETLLLQMELTLAKLVLLVYFTPVPQLKQAIQTKACFPLSTITIFKTEMFSKIKYN